MLSIEPDLLVHRTDTHALTYGVLCIECGRH